MTSSDKEEKTISIPKWMAGGLAAVIVLLLIQSGAFLYYLAKDSTKPHAQEIASSRPSYYDHSPAHTQPLMRPSVVPQRAARPAASTYHYDPFSRDPFSSIQQMESSMNQLFDQLLSHGSLLGSSGGGRGAFFDFSPTIDLEDSKDHYTVRADLPGLDKEKINVTVRGQILTIQGIRESGSETKDEDSGYYAQERSYGSFSRSVQLPGPVDDTKIEADYKDGVLTVTLPKTEAEADSQKVAVT